MIKRFWRRPERRKPEAAAAVALAEPEPGPELAFDELGLEVGDEAIAETIAPFVRERYARDDPEWVAIVADRRRRVRRKMELPETAERKWTQERTLESYLETWKIDLAAWLSTEGAVRPCEWRNEGLFARPTGLKRVHQLALMRVFDTLRPQTVLEVGSGNGVNLFVLAARYPDLSFTGVELTETGVTATKAVMAEQELPGFLRAFSPEPLVDPGAHTRLDVRQGDATALPFEDGSFDLVYTVQALEVMDPVRDQVLAELRRVSRGHVAMVEPFYEWHATGLRREMIVSKGYFAQPIEDLGDFGLEPIVAMADLPHKLDYQPGLVVARARA